LNPPEGRSPTLAAGQSDTPLKIVTTKVGFFDQSGLRQACGGATHVLFLISAPNTPRRARSHAVKYQN